MRAHRHTQAAALVLLLFCVVPCAKAGLSHGEAQSVLMEANGLFHQANQAALKDPEQAKVLYEKSARRFQRLIEAGGIQNGKLYYNLGNACYLAGDLGRAILNYRRAERYMPNNGNLRQNLAQARARVKDRIEAPQRTKVLKTLFFFHYDLAPRSRANLFTGCFAAFWLILGLRLFLRGSWLSWMAGGAAALSVCLGASLVADAYALSHEKAGVILAPEVVARKGDGENYQPSFEEPLHAGTEFSMREVRGGWCYVELRNGKTCWLPEDSLKLVRSSAQR